MLDGDAHFSVTLVAKALFAHFAFLAAVKQAEFGLHTVETHL